MAKLFDLDEAEWDEWLKDRPPAIKALAMRYPPNRLYRLGGSGHRVTIMSYGEFDDGTVGFTVLVSGKFNFVMFERTVFGIKADDLTECDLPGSDGPLGSMDMPIEAVKEMMDLMPKVH